MSDMKATVERTNNGFSVCGYEKIEYDFEFLEGVFDVKNRQLANCYTRWNRCLAVMDLNMFSLYGQQVQAYFDHHRLALTIHKTEVGEKAKNMDTLLGIVNSMTSFGVFRKEPVLVIGGGLVTDVAGFACAIYRRNTNFIRIPTTVIGLIDASVSIKVAVNYGDYKNRLGAYHAPIHTFLDFTFLRTLPRAQIRNGFAELIKISSCSDQATFNLLDRYCEELIDTAFGQLGNARDEVKKVADKICRDSIFEMLRLETPNLHEIMLDRIIAYGHTWSPLHELVPEPPLRHGHAISIDMAYSATLARQRNQITQSDHDRLLKLFSRAGLSMDHDQFDGPLLERATAAILRTRDGKLRAAVPISPMGTCVFLNDVDHEEMVKTLRIHKELMATYPRRGAGIDAYVDASDTGDATTGGAPLEITCSLSGDSKTVAKTSIVHIYANGLQQVDSNGDVNGHGGKAVGGTV